MITQKTIEDAKMVRHTASIKHGYPEKDFSWVACVSMALRGEKMDTAKEFRVLVKSGWGLLSEEIATVYFLPEKEQEQYLDSGNMVAETKDSDTKKVKCNDSKTAKKITENDSSDYLYSSESIMWEITEEEEAAILAEMSATEKAKQEQAEKDRKEYEETHKKEIAMRKKVSIIKAEKAEKGLAKCWECGGYVPFQQLDEMGYCGC